MRIVVCVKQVPDTTEVKIDPKTGTLIREGVPSILNPDDANALEEALKMKDKDENVTVSVVSMGPPQADVMLRECLAMGADEAYLVSDRAFAGSDTWATSKVIASAIRKIGNYDIIFAGRQAIDGDTAQVGPQISEKLGIPQVTYVQDFRMEDDKITVQRQLEDGYEIIRVKKPALLTAVSSLNEPRYMAVDKIFDAYKKEIKVLTIDDLDIEKEGVGLKASPTKVFRSFTPAPKGKGVMLEGSAEEMAEKLVVSLKQKHII
ncbi:electron transfer flavoprotein subunit beta/FixA family protein [Clostridium botulinum]|uniref:Electron transfer flavoprotein small subunit n=1 Tax=Clostridium botulinum (strain Okra / Type B1) TaxID=498213 RepID=B1IGU2_CLOBK|nr:electron transfer flavoprotein subunit beta [Clostridium botulinum]EKX79830.1 electron transfer flavoprotein subunit beta/FixA family protein [Clostridium botulinum CFSAN001628]ACA45840.1 electron transfer flavoprotein, beta subunit/FixA family protein [Clostridium botulinum B1 str. Okra]MBD5563989.1 electron transfer flavoprotein subunit beta/FixA family protein [Clostridium botulinum]MBD5566641.1 electron transfer flavoprotein subunit beta/FixA family protein [Clostridium botulinum]MBD556